MRAVQSSALKYVARQRGHTGGSYSIFLVRGSEPAHASALPKNMWLEDASRQGELSRVFVCVFDCIANAKIYRTVVNK